MDHYLIVFVAAFVLAALVVLLRVRHLLWRSREKMKTRGKLSKPQKRVHRRHRQRSTHRAQLTQLAKHPPLPRDEVEKVFAEAETAAVNSALGDLEAERNPYAPDTRPGILWETHFNLVFMEWAGKPRPTPRMSQKPSQKPPQKTSLTSQRHSRH